MVKSLDSMVPANRVEASCWEGGEGSVAVSVPLARDVP